MIVGRPREEGVYQQPDGSLVIVFPSNETRDRIRSQTVTSPAVEVLMRYLRERWGQVIQGEEGQEAPQESGATGHHKTDVAIAVIEERPGMRGGAVCSELLYRMGENEENQKLRNTTLGFINELAERGLAVRDEEDRFWPLAYEQTKLG